VLTPDTARRAGVISIATIQSAGVGSNLGFREMQVARIDQLKIGPLTVKNVVSIIKAPAMTGLPVGEKESFSPLALGLSVIIDYQRNVLTLARELPRAEYATRLPLRVSRLAFVRVMINRTTPASFVIDTGGEASVLSRVTATQLNIDPQVRKVPVRVYGSSGWDRGAFLLPYVDVQLAPGVGLEGRSLIVLNLDSPSALLGINVGGLLGYEFLRKYVVAIDLPRHELGLTANH
jgi:predicted aspartyl protease